MSTNWTDVLGVIQSGLFCLCSWLHLIWMTFDIKVDGELQSDALLHGLLQSRDLLSSKFVPGDEGQINFCETSGLTFHMQMYCNL